VDENKDLVKACNDLYLPAFVKMAEALGEPITSEETLRDMLEIATTLRAKQAADADITVKSAKASLFAQLGIEPEGDSKHRKEASLNLPDDLKAALSRLL